MENYDLIDLIWKMCKADCSTPELEEVLPKAIFICKRLDVRGESIINIIKTLIKLKKIKLLEEVNEETIEIIELIYNNQPFREIKQVVDYSDIMRLLLIPRQLNEKGNEDSVFENRVMLELTTDSLRKIMDNPTNFKKIMALYSYNKDLFDLVFIMSKSYKQFEEKNIYNPNVLTTIKHLFGVFYDKQEKYNKDYSLIDELINNISSSPNAFIEYCKNERIKAIPLTLLELKQTSVGIEKLLDEAFEYKKTSGESK